MLNNSLFYKWADFYDDIGGCKIEGRLLNVEAINKRRAILKGGSFL